MTALLRLLLVVPLAYIATVVAAALVIVFGVFGSPGANPAVLLVGAAAATTVLVGSISFAPAVVAIIVAEALSLRSPFYFIGVGGLIGFAAGLLGDFGPDADWSGSLGALYAAAGFVGGFVYWLIAGQSSGARIATSPGSRSA
ncbi:MAG: translation initiation factor IF-3 [Bauldia sp.]